MTDSAPLAIVIRTAGTNCDREMARAFELAGTRAETLHVGALVSDPGLLARADLVGLPGGFSYGDDIASGRVLAVKLREHLYGPLREAAERGCPMIGVCNGFQVLVQVGLLPGPRPGEAWPPDGPPAQRVSLVSNRGGRFVDRWVEVRPEARSVCLWTAPLAKIRDREVMRLPVAHGEGRFVADSVETIADLEATGRIALRYADNFNGSDGAIAGICDATGRIFGLMPHPERYLEWTRHPWWTRLDPGADRGETPGLRMFRAAVRAASGVGA